MAMSGLATEGKELQGKVALVTGGAKNIGRAISLALAAGGAPIAVNTQSSREDADAVTRPAHRTPRVEAKGTIPLGRWGASEEIAATVRFLCGPGSGFITGQTLHVNGGQMMFA